VAGCRRGLDGAAHDAETHSPRLLVSCGGRPNGSHGVWVCDGGMRRPEGALLCSATAGRLGSGAVHYCWAASLGLLDRTPHCDPTSPHTADVRGKGSVDRGSNVEAATEEEPVANQRGEATRH